MEASKTFEESMDRLETIVSQMEKGNVPLEEALRLFEEGTSLIRACSKQLDDAELKVVQLMKGPDGAPAEAEFAGGAEA